MKTPLFLVLLALATATHAAAPKRALVFILAGQSNMEGKAKVTLLETQLSQQATQPLFSHFRQDGRWAQRDDVWIKFWDRRGPLTAGFGSPNCVGPELQFGWTVGDRIDEPVVLVKTAWGGRSLWQDFRPPSAGLPSEETLQKLLTQARKKRPDATLDDVKKPFGASYRAMLEEATSTMTNLGKLFPALAGARPELAGFIWFQGWNDMINTEYTAEYADNLAWLIRDVRRDLDAPRLPFVVAQMGVDGTNANRNVQRFKAAQEEATNRPDFRDNVRLVRTDAFWDYEADAVFRKGWRENLVEWNKVGSDYPYHYLGSPKTLCGIGKACGEAVLDLLKRR